MRLERKDYFDLVKKSKVSDLNSEFSAFEDSANDLICGMIKTIKKVMREVYKATGNNTLILGNGLNLPNDFFTLSYLEESDYSNETVFVTIEKGCNSDDVGETYEIDNMDKLTDAERLLSILSWLV